MIVLGMVRRRQSFLTFSGQKNRSLFVVYFTPSSVRNMETITPRSLAGILVPMSRLKVTRKKLLTRSLKSDVPKRSASAG